MFYIKTINMKCHRLFLLFFFALIYTSIQATELTLFKALTVEPNVTKDGVKGMTISYTFNLTPIEDINPKDTVLKNASFVFKTTFSENDKPIKSAKGYNSVSNETGNVVIERYLSLTETEATKNNQTIRQFVPYAALQLDSGKHTIDVTTIFSGKDGNDIAYKTTLKKPQVQILKPKVKIFTMDIDYIEVNDFNRSGQAWDYAFFKTDAPDVGVNILIGGTSVYKAHVNDTHMFAVGPNSKNIIFAISENDKVKILIQNIDIMFNDDIANWDFYTNDKKTNTVYTYNKSKGNIKSCNLTFKITD